MRTHQSTADQHVVLFWENYLKRIRKSDIELPFPHWYVMRQEGYIAASTICARRTMGRVSLVGRPVGFVDAIQNLVEQVAQAAGSH